MAQETNQFDFADMGTAEPMSEIQKRKASLQQKSQEAVQNIQQTSQVEEQTMRQKDALSGMQQQMSNMRRAADYQKSNFDESLKMERDLSAINASAKADLYDKQMQFTRDSAGRKMMNERQLADWMITKAAGEEDLRGFEQRSQQLHNRKLQLMQAAYAKIAQAEKQVAQRATDERSRQLKMELTKAKAEADKKIAKQKAKSGAARMMIKGVFTVAGAVVGGMAGTAAGGVGAGPGAVYGASLAGGLGDAVGSQV